MKYTSVFTVLIIAASAFAQRAVIGEPKPWDTVRVGKSFKARMDTPDSDPNKVEHVHLTVSIKPCEYLEGAGDKCFTSDGYGTILYDGKYKPTYNSKKPELPPHDTLTVKIPDDFPLGNALIESWHEAIVGGDRDHPYYDSDSVEVVVVDRK
ncbi:hypothetical protein VNI00_009332 [Paramarasmius palmivorus]|uniref:Uncharacterized protein n=1 Tax=Paramarasmius palmivorus TaxID=297713 RepID=A0AAW0CSJ6_9AGAR